MPSHEKDLETAILELLHERTEGKTICPSEAARRVYGSLKDPQAMSQTRAAAARLVARRLIEVTQKGDVVNLATVKGPIRLRLVGARRPV